MNPLADIATTAYLGALTAVDGTKVVKAAVRRGLLDDWLEDRHHPRRLEVLALGKAAPAMLWGLVEASVPFRGLGVAPPGSRKPLIDTFTWLDGEHPVPGPGSFRAGQKVLEWVAALPVDAPVLVLLSGGASSIVEVPRDGDEESLVTAWKEELRAGHAIDELNRLRSARSSLKAGGLGKALLERTGRVRVWLFSDVPPGREETTVASGPLAGLGIRHEVLASNHGLLDGAEQMLRQAGFDVHRHASRLSADVSNEVERFLETLDGLPHDRDVALIAGGEPILPLPKDPPPGGRCQHVALLAARRLAATGSDALVFAAGSDGIDGTTREAGAWSDAKTWDADAQEALERFDAHRFLEAGGLTLRTGPSATNVNDLWIALRPAT